MQQEREDDPDYGHAERSVLRWNISSGQLRCHQGFCAAVKPAVDQALSTNPELVTCASPVVSLWFGLARGIRLLQPFSNLRKLELPSAFQQNLRPVLCSLQRFPRLEDLTLRSVDITPPRWPEMFPIDEDAAKPFCDFSKLKRLVLDDVQVDQLFFTWLAEAKNLEILELKDMSYEGDLDSLSNMKSLRDLVVTGCCDHFCSVLKFVSFFTLLNDLTIEMGAPSEEDLRLLSKCSADIHLKVGRCYHRGQINAICEIRNLKSLTLSSPFGFKIPRKFKDLTRLTYLSFIDEGDAFNEFDGDAFDEFDGDAFDEFEGDAFDEFDEDAVNKIEGGAFSKIEGFENVPTSVSSLSLHLQFPRTSRLSSFLSGLGTQLSSLSLRQKGVHEGLGLDQLKGLKSLELRGDKELDVEVLKEVAKMTELKHLTIGGCFNVENSLSSLVCSLDLRSLSIENGMITSEGINKLSHLTQLSELALTSCFFRVSNLDDSFRSLSTLTSLTIEYPSGGDQFMAGLLTQPYFTSLDSFQLRIASGDLVMEHARCNDIIVTRSRNCREI